MYYYILLCNYYVIIIQKIIFYIIHENLFLNKLNYMILYLSNYT